MGVVLARQAVRSCSVYRGSDDCGRGVSQAVDGGRCTEVATAVHVGSGQGLWGFDLEGETWRVQQLEDLRNQ